MAYRGTERRRDQERRAAVDIALMLANVEAGFGDFRQAWRHLDAAEELTNGALKDRCVAIRKTWYDTEAGLTQ